MLSRTQFGSKMNLDYFDRYVFLSQIKDETTRKHAQELIKLCGVIDYNRHVPIVFAHPDTVRERLDLKARAYTYLIKKLYESGFLVKIRYGKRNILVLKYAEISKKDALKVANRSLKLHGKKLGKAAQEHYKKLIDLIKNVQEIESKIEEKQKNFCIEKNSICAIECAPKPTRLLYTSNTTSKKVVVDKINSSKIDIFADCLPTTKKINKNRGEKMNTTYTQDKLISIFTQFESTDGVKFTLREVSTLTNAWTHVVDLLGYDDLEAKIKRLSGKYFAGAAYSMLISDAKTAFDPVEPKKPRQIVKNSKRKPDFNKSRTNTYIERDRRDACVYSAVDAEEDARFEKELEEKRIAKKKEKAQLYAELEKKKKEKHRVEKILQKIHIQQNQNKNLEDLLKKALSSDRPKPLKKKEESKESGYLVNELEKILQEN